MRGWTWSELVEQEDEKLSEDWAFVKSSRNDLILKPNNGYLNTDTCLMRDEYEASTRSEFIFGHWYSWQTIENARF